MHAVQTAGTRVSAHHQPVTLDEALVLIEPARRCRPTDRRRIDLLLDLARGGNGDVSELVDLTRIPGLDAIVDTGDEPSARRFVTHGQVISFPLVVAHALPLAQACLEVGSAPFAIGHGRGQRRHQPARPTTRSRVARPRRRLELARRRSASDSARGVPRRLPRHGAAAGRVVSAIRVPDRAHRRRRVRQARQPQGPGDLDRPRRLALAFDGDAVRTPGLALGSVAPTVIRVGDAEAALIGRPLTDETIAAPHGRERGGRPIDDVRADRRVPPAVAEVVVRRA